MKHLGGSFRNYARIESRDSFINSGTLDNQGILDVISTILLTVGANASVNPGTSPGTLTVLGSMMLDGVLELELSPTASDHLDVTGTLVFNQGATVRFSFLGGLLAATGRWRPRHDLSIDPGRRFPRTLNALALLFGAADHLAGSFLHLASGVLERALDLILVHDFTLS